MSTMGRLVDVDQFADMILKTDNNGGLVRVRDVAKIELGALAYDQTCTLDGQSSVALSVYQLPGSNALKVARDVKAKMEESQGPLPLRGSTIASCTTPRRSSASRFWKWC